LGSRLALALVLCAPPLHAQDNYEIQVYASETVAKGTTMVELHSNYTPRGLPQDSHAWHETVEITRGLTTWFETGFYIFTDAGQGKGWEYVGNHLRPRVRVPADWHWPVGVSLSSEFGYIRPRFSEEKWTWEIRPIIDKEMGRWYVSFNPAVETRFEFSPALNVKYDATPLIAAGIEYYGGSSTQQIFPSIDLNFSPEWEFNAGVGFGLTKATDRTIVKVIVGRRWR
jgi:hypothetical protein